MLKISNLSLPIHEKNLFSSSSFSIPSQNIIALIGENGAGKTSLLNILAGKIKPDIGAINTNNQTISLIEQFIDQPNQTIAEYLENYENWEIYCALNKLDLKVTLDKKICELSGGQKTKLS